MNENTVWGLSDSVEITGAKYVRYCNLVEVTVVVFKEVAPLRYLVLV